MSFVRTCAEALGHHLTIKRTLPPEYGGRSFYVSGEGGLSYFKPSLKQVDLTLLNLARECVRPGDMVWDTGANVGLFTFTSSGLTGPSGQVIAVEPDATLVSLLRRSTGLIRPDNQNIKVIPTAISDEFGVATFHVAKRARASNFLEGGGKAQHGGTREVQSVITVTVDWLAERMPKPNVMKIDVEGLELNVLRGARATIGGARPTIICAVNARNTAAVTVELHQQGYAIFDGEKPPANRVEAAEALWATLAIPRERCI